MITRFIFLVAAILLANGSAFAMGGNGATCNPSTPNWGSCELAPIPFQSSVTNTSNIPGGNYTTPFQATQANTRYVLQGNITANGTAVEVKATHVIIDLNGYTITYNQVSPGEGVVSGAWNLNYIAVRNGSIIQGAAMSEGNEYGQGNNPVGTYNAALGVNLPVPNLHVSNLYVRYGGRDVGGIICSGDGGLYEQNTIEDTYEFGTLKNRHQGNEALTGSKNEGANGNVYRNNTIVNARHRGITTGHNAEVYGNKIYTRSIATNAAAIYQFDGQNITINDNTIIGRGEHPIGIMAGGSNGAKNYKVYSNYIDLQTTALGIEYGSSYANDPTATYVSNAASGVRVTWGGDNLNFYNNQIIIKTSARYKGTYSPTGTTAYIDGGGKGLFIGIYSGQTATFTGNTISVTGDGRYTYGVTCSYNFSDGLFVLNNSITSNLYNIVIGDDYGACNGYPLFQGNILIKTGASAAYSTIINTYNETDRHAQARFVDNLYQDGASEASIALLPQNGGLTDIYFGTRSGAAYGYDKRLHDSDNTSSTVAETIYDPAVTLDHASPATCAEWSALCSSLVDCSNNWPGATWNEETGCNVAGIIHPNRRLSFGGGLLKIAEQDP